mmetsp:Transcript_91880/g.176884  ORF Transcript_91880/g.176884 Transcript_91880/m.176884 type:complete len:1016 (+) Transcript_91880:71-3118(+)
MVLTALLAAAGGVGANIWGQVSVEDFMQNYMGDFMSTSRNMYADQKLQQRFFGVEMNIAKEQLYREDVRDLMELTVGRMDVYLIVGTLMLTFCIEWFTDAEILTAKVPEWFRTLFLVSNFSAVGYLVLSVWLAMHASVAAHSVGVRLLTSFARLTIPSREELRKFRVTLVPKLKEFLALGRAVGSLGKQQVQQARGWLGRSSASKAVAQEEPTAVGDASVPSGAGAASGPQGASSAMQALVNNMAEELGQAASEPEITTGVGDMQHIQRFMKEQRMWLGYDAYSRVCMSLGMNQLLQALSYYVVGKLSAGSLTSSIATFFGIKVLSIYLLRLDITAMCESWREYAIVLFFMVVPTTFAATAFLLASPMIPGFSNSFILQLSVTPVFVLHGIWLLYVVFDIDPFAPRFGLGSAYTGLPKRIRTVNYLDVCNEQQQMMVENVRQKEATSLIAPLRAALNDLAERVNAAIAQERLQGSMSQVQRGDINLRKASERLAEELERARNGGAAATTALARTAFFDAERALSRYDVWEKVPEIFASLNALREQSVNEYLTDEQKQVIEQSYQEFLQRCRDLELGIVSDDTSGGLQVAISEAETKRVRVDANVSGDHAWSGYLPSAIWVDVKDGSVVWQKPNPDVPTTSFKTVVGHGKSWARKAEELAHQPATSLEMASVGPPQSQSAEQGQTLDRHIAAHGGQEAEEPTYRRIPSNAVPDEAFPGKIVRRFTMWTSAWWFISAFLHGIDSTVDHPEIGTAVPQLLAKMGAADLDHAAFFEVTSLNCNSSHVLLADHFSWWIAERRPHSALKFIDHIDAGIATQLSWVRQQQINHAVPMHVPDSWRMVTAAWEACAGLECNKARLAGWDGASVVVATAYINAGSEGAWRVNPEFRVHPGLGHRASTSRFNSFLRSSFTSPSRPNLTYHDVIAMHLSPGGQMLTVLFRGSSSSHLLLDTWNLSEGTLLGTWFLDSQRYTGVCHDGERFLLAQKDEDGPAVHTLELPLPVQQPSLQRGRSSGFLEA